MYGINLHKTTAYTASDH